MTTQSTTARLRAFVNGQIELSRELLHAAQKGSMSPYHYVKPFLLRAADIGEPPLAPTPHKVVYTNGKMRLLRFEPAVRKHATPILFVYSLINRYYILDFLPGRSLIEFMVGQGFDVYAIDWGTPGSAERRMGWDDVLNVLVKNAVKWALRLSGAKDLTMYGYCMGGTMALAYAALHPQGLRNFVAQATPVDFHEGGVFAEWTKPNRFDVDALVDAYGNVPIELMETGFSSMAPVQRMTKWLEVCRRIDDPDFVTTFLGMEHWASDNVQFPGEIYRQYIKDCYQYNNFCTGRMKVAGQTVDLSTIQVPLLNIIADNDTIAPPKSSEILNTIVRSTDKEIMRFPVGHIGLSTSSKGPKQIWPKVAGWIAKRSDPWTAT
ncbi:alpha/beta fold hydrolase [Polyangium sorediatum]|uniref:Alpha/beta fold hydrolase n=1 Tax=Polyangium sorediatum TaxID=889274 RepID=A0ABT6NRU8_9BACT|nr:alpha/beta fold hydrolase [Polyangium sorediatum]MDI1430880.1 alpha/beta fold hydrolase [Polyangium sorediatum]